jgi:hypothetical protein
LERVASTLDRVDRQPALDPAAFFFGSGRESELLAIECSSSRSGDVVITLVGSEYGAAGRGLVDYSSVAMDVCRMARLVYERAINVIGSWLYGALANSTGRIRRDRRICVSGTGSLDHAALRSTISDSDGFSRVTRVTLARAERQTFGGLFRVSRTWLGGPIHV